jgi:hypothetical protein
VFALRPKQALAGRAEPVPLPFASPALRLPRRFEKERVDISPLRSAVLLALAAGCTPRAGNDPAMTPQVVRHAREQFALLVDSGSDVAVFAVLERRSGWALHLLTPDSASGRAPALRTLTYSMVRPGHPPGGKTIRFVHYVPVRRCIEFRNWADRADSAKFYNWGCFYGVRAVQRSIDFPGTVPDSGRFIGSYYLIAASTSRLTAAQWTELADSTGVVAALIHLPERLGRLAFATDSTTRWAMTVQQITGY